MIVGNTDLERLRYSLEKASSTTEFWNKKIKELNIKPEELTMKTLDSLIDELTLLRQISTKNNSFGLNI
jgi:hypothetical protein